MIRVDSDMMMGVTILWFGLIWLIESQEYETVWTEERRKHGLSFSDIPHIEKKEKKNSLSPLVF